jgi:biopolymer transport protein ExbD
MAFGGFTQNQSHQPVAEINMIPLIDVMLVLLVIFIVTAPLLTHAVRIDLPQAAAQPAPQKPETIALALDGDGRVYWNREPITLETLRPRLVQAAAQQPQPELHLHADKNTRYQQLAEVMAAVQNAGLQKLGFITTPSQLRK